MNAFRTFYFLLFTFYIASSFAAGPKCQAMRFADIAKVRVDDSFWSPKFRVWRMKTVYDVLCKLEEKSHAFENFDLAARGAERGFAGDCWFDGLCFEAIRGASDYYARNPSDDLACMLSNVVGRIVAAQLPDGYLHTWVQIGNRQKRWGDNGGCAVAQHEIYNAGCLIEAGLHHCQATGDVRLLAAAVRFANCLCDTMGPLPKRNLIPSHSLAEEALVNLVRFLKDYPDIAARTGVAARPDDYLALVKFWFGAHGNHCGQPDWAKIMAESDFAHVISEMSRLTKTPHDASWRVSFWDYQMDAKPLRDYAAIEGHAVRAALMVLGLAAYARETGDAESLALAKRFWNSMTGRKMYVSGGVGAKADLERFSDDFDLPPNAYLETCAAVASAFTSGCLAEITGDGVYMDEFERVAYNALLTAVGEDGRSYTYQNPLNTERGERWEWHNCPCCPPMFLKMTGALPGYAYASGRDGLSVNLFMGGGAELEWNGRKVGLSQRTGYPNDGRIAVTVATDGPVRFPLRMRVPGWARGIENHAGLYVSDGVRPWSLTLNGEPVSHGLDRGYAVIDREWRSGDTVTLTLDVSPRVKAVRDMHAVACGPVLMAEEKGRTIPYWRVANGGPAPHRVWLPDTVPAAGAMKPPAL